MGISSVAGGSVATAASLGTMTRFVLRSGLGVPEEVLGVDFCGGEPWYFACLMVSLFQSFSHIYVQTMLRLFFVRQ